MKYKTILPLIALGLAGAGGWHWWVNRPAMATLPPPQPAAIPVETAAVGRQDVPVYLTGIGTVQSLNTVTITARVDGQIQKIGFTEGQEVKAGDLLVQIDPRTFQAALDQAIAKKAQDVAQLANAQRDLQRFTALSQKQFASQQQLDTERAQVDQLQAAIQGDQAAIDNARTQLDYTSIRAPLSGRAGFRLIDQGNNVHASDTAGIVVITQLHPISVVFTLPEEDLPAVMKAMSAGSVAATALGSDNKTVLGQGKVTIVDNQIDQATGTARFKAEFQNDDNALWPGEFVNIRVLQGTQQNVLTVPSIALQHGPDGLFAYVVKPDNTVTPQPIQVSYDTGQVAVVSAGLDPGQQVVTGGQYRLQAGTLVKAKQTAKVAGADKSAQNDAGVPVTTVAQVAP
ncbi:MAG TPA: efflux RND transporter periplasmic adaptor subunit [Terriglobales bacterium]|nr:efflux RND transporter periplasmic adaptor subunit [Terriglobales bacterium]